MISLILLGITWYITKIYYTRSFKFILAKSDFIELRCHRCNTAIYRYTEHIKEVENYCSKCS